MKQLLHLLPVFLFYFLIGSPSVYAQEAGQDYVLKRGDWLSKIASKVYDNPHLYFQIIEATNKRALSDNSYQHISDVSALTPGQKIWIPLDKATKNDAVLVAIPKTNCEIRVWYNYQVVAIGVLDKRWQQEGVALKDRAKKAHDLRHAARVNARFMMANKAEVAALQQRDIEKYGNPDGPTFEQLVLKNTKKGLTTEEAYLKIIESSSRVSAVYNAECI